LANRKSAHPGCGQGRYKLSYGVHEILALGHDVMGLGAVGRVFLNSIAFFEEGIVHAADYISSRFELRQDLIGRCLGRQYRGFDRATLLKTRQASETVSGYSLILFGSEIAAGDGEDFI